MTNNYSNNTWRWQEFHFKTMGQLPLSDIYGF